MSKCPKCSYAISSIDVLCPKCGALVEQINTNAAPKIVVAPETTEPSKKTEAAVPNHYENLIVYNETYMENTPFKDTAPQTQPVAPDFPVQKIPDDFDIDNIISSANSAPRVNPLFAHIERSRLQAEAQQNGVTVDTPQTPDADPAPAPLEQEDALPIQNALPDPVFEEIALEPEPIEEELPIEQEEPIADDFEFQEDVPPIAFQEEEPFVAPSIEPDVAAFATDEILQQDPSEEKRTGLLDSMPAYSQAYLDALRNIELTEDELEIEESFDPDAFMKKFKKGAVDVDNTDSISLDNVTNAAPVPITSVPNDNNQPAQETKEEPRRRRYNPNRVKPLEEDEEELDAKAVAAAALAAAQAAAAQAAATAQAMAAAQAAQAAQAVAAAQAASDEDEDEIEQAVPPKTKKGKAATSKNASEDTFHKQSKAKVADDELLEMTLEPNRFFAALDEDESKDSEEFIFDQDLESPFADEHTSSGPMNPYSAAVARPVSDIPKSASAMTDSNAIKSGKRKGLPVWAAILIWLFVAGGIFFGTYMLDNHVKANYGGYGEYLSEITNGKIDLDSLIN